MTKDQLPEKLRRDPSIKMWVPGERIEIHLKETAAQEIENFNLPYLEKQESA